MRAAIPICALAALAVGCQSVDPGHEFATASSLVRGRTGHGLPDYLASPESFEAIRLALRNHPAVQQDLASIAEARADFVQSGLLPNPVLTVETLMEGGALRLTMAAAMQSLSELWLRPSRVGAAEARLQEAVLGHVRHEEEKIFPLAKEGLEQEDAEEMSERHDRMVEEHMRKA